MLAPVERSLPRLAPTDVIVERAGAGRVLRARAPLPAGAATLFERLEYWSERRGAQPFLTEPSGVTLRWQDAQRRVEGVARWLLARGARPERPVAALSGNSVSLGLFLLGAMRAGLAVAPISPSYSLLSKDFTQLKHALARLDPSHVFVESVGPYEAALRATGVPPTAVVTVDDSGRAYGGDRLGTGEDRGAALLAVDPHGIAKILFTSGSTGLPKGVINTHAMLSANQRGVAAVWPFLTERPPVFVDWLPWHHTFGGNANFNLTVWHGGTLHIDAGRPTPERIGQTVEALQRVQPTAYFSVPAGYDALLPHLERDRSLARRLFERLDCLFYAAAPLAPVTWERLERVAVDAVGRRPFFASAWGCTETAPTVTKVHAPIDRAGVIGTPLPAVEVKLEPVDTGDELRVRGPNVTPGYWRDAEATAAAFDADGWYRTGDVGRLVDETDPNRGLAFVGRLAEEFKLASGTWVRPADVRVGVLATIRPWVLDVAVCGERQSYLALLAFVDVAAARRQASLAPELTAGEVAGHAWVRRAIADGLARYNAAHPASSTRIRRVVLLAEAPDGDAGEITDKGYLNQRAALKRRSTAVARLYAEPPPPDVLTID